MPTSYRVLYFTGTGNAAYVANEIFKKIEAKGNEAKILAVDELWAACGRSPITTANLDTVRQKLKEFLNGAQVLLVLYTVRFSMLPLPIKDLVSLFPDTPGMKLATIAVCSLNGGDCCYLLHDELRARGYQSLFAMDIKMPHNITFPYLAKPPVENGDELEKFYPLANKEIDFAVDKITTEQKYIKGNGILARLMGMGQRFLERFLGKGLANNMFATDACIKCKRCVNGCPMANIRFDNLPQFGNKCCLCMRCYSFCPVCAIQVTKKTLDTRVYVRYRGFNHWVPPRLYKID